MSWIGLNKARSTLWEVETERNEFGLHLNWNTQGRMEIDKLHDYIPIRTSGFVFVKGKKLLPPP